MTDQPIAWTGVEPGWRVVASDGTDAGTVEQAVGDRDADIFEGFAIDVGHGKARFLPHTQIQSMEDGAVRVRLTAEELRSLPEHEQPESLRIEADPAALDEEQRSWWRRLLGPR
jgi:hypothetical protein